MRIIGMKKAVVAAGFALALSAAAAPAHAVLIGASGTWTSVTSNSASFLNGVGTDTIAWGAQWNNRRYAAVPQSSYNFTGWNADLLLPTTATPLFFGLGAFTHNNQVIGGTSITQAILGLSVDIGGATLNFSAPFGHTETYNYPTTNFGFPCAEGGSEPCPDLVRLTTVDISEAFSLGGQAYRFNLAGFFKGDGASGFDGTGIVDRFLTVENQSNVAILVGKLSLVSIPVPEPATLGLFALGILGMGGLAHRRRRQVV